MRISKNYIEYYQTQYLISNAKTTKQAINQIKYTLLHIKRNLRLK